MAPLTEPDLLALLREALSEWNCEGYIQWKRLPAEWLHKNLPEHTQKAIGQLMYEFVAGGGEVDQVRETREEYRGLYKFHYDFRIPLGDRLLYIETRLDETPMGPTIYVVNMHDA